MAWLDWVMGGYALLVFFVVFYNFETSDDPPRGARKLEVATLLMGTGLGIGGLWRAGMVGDGLLLDASGLLVLAAQTLVLLVVYNSYNRVRGATDEVICSRC